MRADDADPAVHVAHQPVPLEVVRETARSGGLGERTDRLVHGGEHRTREWLPGVPSVDRMLGTESFTKLKPFEDTMMQTPPAEQRDALAAAGAPLTRESFGTTTPRRGLMRI